MFKFAKLALAAAVGALLAAPALAEEKAAAKVNDVVIPQSRIDAQLQEAANQGQPVTPEMRKAMLDRAIGFELLAQKAIKDGFDKKPEVLEQIALARETVLVQAYLRDYSKNHIVITEDKLKQEYDKILQNQPAALTRYKVAHILVVTDKEAQAVKAQLKKGGNFAAIARKSSKDPGSKATGGDLGWHSPTDFVEPFSVAMMKLKKGEVSDPVQTEYGWHIIKLEDVQVIPFERVRNDLIQNVQQREIQKHVEELRKSATVVETPQQ